MVFYLIIYSLVGFLYLSLGNITAVITLKSIGEQMAEIVEDGNILFAKISRGKQARPLANINK